MRAGTLVSIVPSLADMSHPITGSGKTKHGTSVYVAAMLGCRVFGHRYRFWAEGPTMRWECSRGCGAAASKEYPTDEDAARYARALDREDRDRIGRRAPLSLLPLRLARRLAGHDRNR
jgi:hypothetical protein